VLIRDRSTTGYDLALVTTDTIASAAQIIERYASRWSIEVAIEDARQVFGAGLWGSRTRSPVLTWDFYAARSYSLMRPPSTGLRLIRFRERSVAG
jgi:hypothetical protein